MNEIYVITTGSNNFSDYCIEGVTTNKDKANVIRELFNGKIEIYNENKFDDIVYNNFQLFNVWRNESCKCEKCFDYIEEIIVDKTELDMMKQIKLNKVIEDMNGHSVFVLAKSTLHAKAIAYSLFAEFDLFNNIDDKR